jgi:hypothetical protein
LAHAFSPPDAYAAQLWRKLVGRPVVFTCTEMLTRDALAHRRLRLKLLARAVDDTDAVIAPTQAAQAALWRWLAVEAQVLEAGDGAGHAELYRELLHRRR